MIIHSTDFVKGILKKNVDNISFPQKIIRSLNKFDCKVNIICIINMNQSIIFNNDKIIRLEKSLYTPFFSVRAIRKKNFLHSP